MKRQRSARTERMSSWVMNSIWMAYELPSSYGLQEALLWNTFIFLLWLILILALLCLSRPPQKTPTNGALSEGKWDISNTRWLHYSAYKGTSALLSVMSLSFTFHDFMLSPWSPLITKTLYSLVQRTVQWKSFRTIFHFLLCYKIFWSLSPVITISFIKMFELPYVKLFSQRVGIFTKNECIWFYRLFTVISAFLSECLSFPTDL